MFKILKEKLFFIIDKDEKEYIRQKVMTGDHTIISIVMAVLLFIELIMLGLSFFGVDEASSASIELAYRCHYLFLIVVCALCLFFCNFFFRKKRTFPYFVTISLFTFATMLWGVGISLLSSFEQFTFLYYAIAMVACSAFICLEPWVTALCVLVSSSIYAILYYTIDGIVRTTDTIFFGGLIIFSVLVLTAFFFNFSKNRIFFKKFI